MENLQEYKYHARLVELRLALLHSLFLREFGVERTANLFKGISDAFMLNWTVISSILNRKDKIYSPTGYNRTRFRQEVVFMGVVYGENREKVGKRYLNLSKKSMYNKDELDPDKFMTNEWLDGLDYTVTVCGMEAYKLEAIRLLDAISAIARVVGDVPLAKIKL